MNRVRVGMVGAGVIGTVHSGVLQQLALVGGLPIELVAVADPSRDARDLFCSTFGYRDPYESGADLIERADIDALFVCTPTVHHAADIERAAARGLHLFCEKPLAMNWTEAERVVGAIEAAGVHAQIGLVLRFSAVYTVMRELLRTGDAGRAMAIVLRDDQIFPVRGLHASAWRGDPATTAGGALIEHGVHDLDLLSWMFGPPIRLRAHSRNLNGKPGIEDYMAVDLEFADGLRAHVVEVWHDMVQRPSNRRLEIFCERGFVASDHDMSGPILHQWGDGAQETLAEPDVLERFIATRDDVIEPLRGAYGLAYGLQGLDFVRALLADRAPEPGIRVGLEAQRLAAAAYESARIGSEIELAGFVPPATPGS